MRERRVHFNIATTADEDRSVVTLCNAAGKVDASQSFYRVTCENCLRDPYFATMRLDASVRALVDILADKIRP